MQIEHHHTAHITDFFTSIDLILVTENADKYVFDPYEEWREELFYLTCSKTKLRKMPDFVARSLTDRRVLRRVHEVCPEKLSPIQEARLDEYLARKYKVSNDDVQKILNMLKSCNRIKIEDTEANKDFDLQYGISDSEKLEIIQQLTLSDYTYSTKSYTNRYMAHDLIVFQPNRDITLSDGSVVKNIKIYIKIDINQTHASGSTMAVVSFHESDPSKE